jgi:DNA-nicking Smr family endonuclease
MNSQKKKHESKLFREAMADVTPLNRGNRLEPIPKKTPAAATQLEKDNREVLKKLLDPAEDHLLETGEELIWLKPGYQSRVMQRLRRGHYSVADSIDLHHMDVTTAKQVLLDFIEHSLEQRHSCVRVIHGKGLRSRDLPRLKMMTNRVLRKHPRIVAFASCRPVDGGTGACDVLLSARKAPKL